MYFVESINFHHLYSPCHYMHHRTPRQAIKGIDNHLMVYSWQCKALCRVKEIDINIGEARSTQTIVNLYPITSVVIVYQIICEL